jgi:hypothetical protein
MTPPLLSLPSEVLIELFSYLHPRDIAACQRSCRQLNDTVSHSQLLRYLIRVGELVSTTRCSPVTPFVNA